MKHKAIILTSYLALVLSCKTETKTTEAKTVNTVNTETTMTDLKTIVNNGQDAFFKNYSEEGIRTYFDENYIQHNPHTPTGIAPVIQFLPALKEAGTTYKTHRLLQDGNLVVAHNTYDNAEAFGAKEMVTFDIYRIENNKIAEHWDAVTPKVTETASGRSQIDGPTVIVDLDKTETNKKIIKNFMKDVMMGENPSKITDYISTETYKQHNTAVKDGLDGLNEAIAYLTSQNNMFVYKKVHKILGEGNFVFTQSEGEWNGGKPYAFYDLYRLKDGKIVEHWDVIQEVPTKQAHTNGMF
ncbi:nuclear transport factor 2 family protein [Psychroserpens sp. S379A]|uniref:nuclear transport factor 2 family protein n=1 Tax=Psychroserpens sp. S379A TaxID=3415137 RepID=UPI003C7E5A86